MSITCHSRPSAIDHPSRQVPPASPTKTRRRWGGIFTPNGDNQYGRPRPPVLASQAAPTSEEQAMNAISLSVPAPTVNAKEEVCRRPSLARSNAVCHRRSRAVSHFSVDSAESITEQIDIRWSRGSSSPIADPSTAATSPVEGTSPCLEHSYEPSPEGPQAPKLPGNLIPDMKTSPYLIPRGFTGSQIYTNSLPRSSKVNNHTTLHSLDSSSPEVRLRKAEEKAELLEQQNRILRAGLKSEGVENGLGQDHKVGYLSQKWLNSIGDAAEETVPKITADKERERLIKRVNELESILGKKNETIEMCTAKLNMFRRDQPVANKSNPASSTNIDEFEQSMIRLRQAQELMACAGGALTPRKIVLLKLSQQTPSSDAEGTRSSQKATDIGDLDDPLSSEEAIKFARGLDSNPSLLSLDKITIKTCSMCNKPKLLNRSLLQYPASARNTPAIQTLNEFDPSFGTTSCCSKPICITCLPPAIASAITRDWWHKLDDPHWVRCPTPKCQATLALEYHVDLTSLLRPLGDSGVLTHVRRFDIAKDLRRALQGLIKQPTPEELRRAAELHEQLTKHGYMRDIFNLSKDTFRFKLAVLPVDSKDGRKTLQVPIFTGLLNRDRQQQDNSGNERECVICADSISDVVDGSLEAEERWTNATAAFPGEWSWRVREFPLPSLLPNCSKKHSIDTCRKCLARHLETSLEKVGRAGCDTLACPIPDCGHVYTYPELKALASPETFAKYDKFRLLSHLATLPNFRWCLREGCESGQIYDPPAAGIGWPSPWDDAGASNRIRCDVCRFDMCFKHQMPWHRGLSCEAYDSLKAHGDPAFEATRTWLESNTKTCPGPGCGVPVEKKGGCFHMTCRACQFEFCWECLADWKTILKNRAVTGARRYDRKAHKLGCYFREDGVPEPTMVVGNDIEEATRHM